MRTALPLPPWLLAMAGYRGPARDIGTRRRQRPGAVTQLRRARSSRPPTPPPAACECALLLPPFSSPYADYATAEGVVGDPALVADCLSYMGGDTTGMTSFSASFDGTTLTASGAWSSAVLLWGQVWFSVSAKAAATFTFTATSTDVLYNIYDCEGNIVASGMGTSPQTSAALSADGIYYLQVSPNGNGSTSFTTCTLDITSSDVFVPNPVIALWDDSGTTRKLWACPKLLLPPLTESTGDWYADCAAADAVLTDALQVSNCQGYFTNAVGVMDSFSFSGGTFSGTASSATGGFGRCWASLNAEEGETLTFAGATNGGSPDMFAAIYDYTGTLIESLGSGGGGSPVTSSALPYTGSYIVETSLSVGPPGAPFTSATIDITSSGALTFNPIQALYDAGLDCPGRLDCGDACP